MNTASGTFHTDAAAYVEEFFTRMRSGGDFVITTATDLDLSPDGGRIAFTAVVDVAGQPDPVRHIAVFDTGTSRCSHLGPGRAPRWDPSGSRLAWLTDQDITVRELDPKARPSTFPTAGAPEYLLWRPDGTALLVGVAEHGAARSDVDGSGLVPVDAAAPRPGVPVIEAAPTQPRSGGRGVWLVDPSSGDSTRVSPPGVTVWQAAWAGGSSILCVTSDDPSESAWYGAELALLDPANRTLRPVPSDDVQVALPAANPSGTRLSAVVGAMSDRGLYAGDLILIDPAEGTRTTVATGGVDVTSQHWDSDTTIVFAGLRGLDTVIGRLHVDTHTAEVLGVLTATCGAMAPEITVSSGIIACTTSGYRRPPALTVLEPGRAPREVVSFTHDGTDFLTDMGGTIERVAWEAPDGLTIEGLLVAPPGPGPHPLVINIHGGPVWAWRDEWSMHYAHTPLLASRGYAVLHPNMRGSLGRGQKFIKDGLLDMGGADAADIVAGIDALVATGRVDPARVAVTGNSYGGFMSAWLVATTDRFAAAIARSPVTDWVSQHYTSNIPGFDRICLTGHPLDPQSSYRTRSPLYLAHHVRTPILLIAGAHDLATPPEQASMFHHALVEHGTDSTLVIYQNEGHGVRGSAAVVDQCARVIDFLDKHLAAGGPQ
ncbi:prolyl oligopeptidase family serine peptidase [Streptomyces hokutonensis]|uniref:S9 family peptidase n=1 Tax=Streptomyces hokutonensis TaxID=1306990 RepID=UPI0037F2A4DD